MASAWKDLPEELSEPARLLAEELRTIKDTAGLSLSELAGRTHYSRASWERWLNGKRVVTEQALEALIGAVDCDAAALRRLWRRATERTPEVAGAEVADAEVADAEEPTTDEPTAETVEGPSAGTAAEPAGEPVPTAEEAPEAAVAWWRRPAALVSGAVLLGLLLVLVGLRVSRHDDQASAADAPAATATPATARPAPSDPPCRAVGCAHKDPKTTGCGKDARTLQTQVIGKVVVYLRYSRTCQAAWAAITEGEPKDYAVITDSTGDSETAMIHWGYDNYSAMVDAGPADTTLRVCGHQPGGDGCLPLVTDPAARAATMAAPSPKAPSPAASVRATESPTPSATS